MNIAKQLVHKISLSHNSVALNEGRQSNTKMTVISPCFKEISSFMLSVTYFDTSRKAAVSPLVCNSDS